MLRDYLLFLDDIRECCEKVLRYTDDIAFDEFMADEKTYDAVLRNLGVIGEACKNVPQQVRSQYPEVEWRKIAGVRDIVAHVYFGVNDQIVWHIVQAKVPVLLEQVKDILRREDTGDPAAH